MFDLSSFTSALLKGNTSAAESMAKRLHQHFLQQGVDDEVRSRYILTIFLMEMEYAPTLPCQITINLIDREFEALQDSPERIFHVIPQFGIEMANLHRYDEARVIFMRMLEVGRQYHESGADVYYLLSSLNAVANIHRQLGRNVDALDYSCELLDVLERSSFDEPGGLGVYYFNHAQLLHALARYSEAEEMFGKVSKLFTEAGRPVDVADVAYDLSVMLAAQGRYEEANEHLHHSLLLRETHLPENSAQIALSYEGMGNSMQRQGRVDEACEWYEKALLVYQTLGLPGGQGAARMLNNLGLMYFRREDFEEAESCFERSLQIAEHVWKRDHPVITDTLRHLAKCRLILTKGEEGMAQVVESLKQFLSQEQFPPQGKQFAADRRNVTEMLIIMARFWNETQQREVTAEAGIACLLTYKGNLEIESSLAALLEIHAGGALSALLAQRTEHRTELARRFSQAPKDRDAAVERRLQKELDDLERRLNAHPEARKLADELGLRSLTRPAVQGALNSNEALLNYLVVEDTIYAQILHPDGHHSFRAVCAAADAQSQLVWLSSEIQQLGDEPLSQLKNLEAALSALGTTLLAPLAEDLRLGMTVDSLVISGDDFLYGVPWDVLKLHLGENSAPLTLLQIVKVRQIPTPRDLVRLRKIEDKNQRQGVLLGVQRFHGMPGEGNEVDASQGPRSRSGLSTDRHRLLPEYGDLPGTRREIKLLIDLLDDLDFDIQPLVSPGVTEQTLLSIDSPFILHIATHSDIWTVEQNRPFYPEHPTNPRLDPAHPFSRAVILLDGYNRRDFQGVFRGWELATLPLTGTALVTLSSCHSGLGDMEAGKAVAGLSQAAFLAGTSRTLTTLWSVLDDRTPEFIAGVYRRFLQGETLQEALRQEKLAWLERDEPFSAFAPFVLNGLA